MNIIFFLINLICILISVAFVTLMERKILSYIQFRKGPNKVGLMGIMQPFSDAIKLFTKETNFPSYSNPILFKIAPLFSFILSLLLWLTLPVQSKMMFMKFSMLFILCCLSVSVYGLLFSGWSSNSKYSLIGSLRSVAQTISYEISLAFIILSIIYTFNSLNLSNFSNLQTKFYSLPYFYFLFFIMLCSILAELNRTPFDFAEGESELVSGFNVEYSSFTFALIFLAEYANIIFMSFLMNIMFLASEWSMTFSLKICLFVFTIILIRGLLPRYRYDKLMYLCWKSILPISMMMFLTYFLYFSLMNY